LLNAWLGAGQDYGAFWDLTPREALAVLRGGEAKRKAEFSVSRALNHHLAGLVAFAFHDPKNIPQFEAAAAPSEVARDVDHERARGALIALALQSRASLSSRKVTTET
jgi:hypothetical protein